jgi:glucosamine-6-phosphate deaminase
MMDFERKIGEMQVTVYESRTALGQAAAHDFAAILREELSNHDEAAVIFATGNSQLSFLEALRNETGIAWERVVVFHMDEYLGISADHPASFRRFIREKITEVFHPRVTYGIEGDAADVEGELASYDGLLKAHVPVICVMGIGENGHLAFNDPPADFQTHKLIHVVTLDETCRRQQVSEGHFPNFDAVPKQALSLTVPALLKPKHVFVLAPEARKAKAVQTALEGAVTEDCPASILRTQAQVKLYLDAESAALVRGSLS